MAVCPVKHPLAGPRRKVWQLAESNHLFDFGSHDCNSRENSANTYPNLKTDKQFLGILL